MDFEANLLPLSQQMVRVIENFSTFQAVCAQVRKQCFRSLCCALSPAHALCYRISVGCIAASKTSVSTSASSPFSVFSSILCPLSFSTFSSSFSSFLRCRRRCVVPRRFRELRWLGTCRPRSPAASRCRCGDGSRATCWTSARPSGAASRSGRSGCLEKEGRTTSVRVCAWGVRLQSLQLGQWCLGGILCKDLFSNLQAKKCAHFVCLPQARGVPGIERRQLFWFGLCRMCKASLCDDRFRCPKKWQWDVQNNSCSLSLHEDLRWQHCRQSVVDPTNP